MNCGRLVWVFAAGFVLFAAPLFFVEDQQDRQFWAGLTMFSLGGFALTMACDGLKTGKVEVQYQTIEYASNPQSFWIAVAVLTLVGIGTVCGGVWMLFLKGA